jgi:MEMO1 family protein
LGGSHHLCLETASVYTRGAFETPLGDFRIDETLADLLAEKTASVGIEAHMGEHSIEVQLPFLHAVIGDVPIVPILFGPTPTEWHAQFGKMLAELTDETDLVIASTDLSHYLSEEDAGKIDRRTLDTVLSQNWADLVSGIRNKTCALCGAAAVAAAMAFATARGATQWNLLDYRTSARASGDYGRVVGYGAISMERAA